jgi:hypothetical protein
MPVCYTCGNDYDKAFTLTLHSGETYHFDSFECAIQSAAPTCARCRCRIIGHGVEAQGTFFCCAHCAEEHGVVGLEDRV